MRASSTSGLSSEIRPLRSARPSGLRLLACARQVYGRLRDGFYGLEVMLVVLVFMPLLREARADGATRIPPAALGRCWVWTGPRKSRRSAASSPGSPSAGRRRTCSWLWPAATPAPWNSSNIDGRTRAYFGKRDIQKMYLAGLKFPGPVTEETWVTRV
jgi:hypothetical protein